MQTNPDLNIQESPVKEAWSKPEVTLNGIAEETLGLMHLGNHWLHSS
jgi:hypothetical protein